MKSIYQLMIKTAADKQKRAKLFHVIKAKLIVSHLA
jgi:hypothetical protein